MIRDDHEAFIEADTSDDGKYRRVAGGTRAEIERFFDLYCSHQPHGERAVLRDGTVIRGAGA